MATSAEVTSSAAAPSLIVEAFAAVTVPSFEKAGRRPAILSSFTREGSSSLSTSSGSPRRWGTSTGTISSLKRPSFWAAWARW